MSLPCSFEAFPARTVHGTQQCSFLSCGDHNFLEYQCTVVVRPHATVHGRTVYPPSAANSGAIGQGLLYSSLCTRVSPSFPLQLVLGIGPSRERLLEDTRIVSVNVQPLTAELYVIIISVRCENLGESPGRRCAMAGSRRPIGPLAIVTAFYLLSVR